jgi:hypothetical protein
MIGIRKTTSGPANDTRTHTLESLQCVQTKAVLIGYFGISANPDSSVNHLADMLRKLAIDSRIDRTEWLIHEHRQCRRRNLGGGKVQRRRGEQSEKLATLNFHWVGRQLEEIYIVGIRKVKQKSG